ncbi:MAG: glucose 1-dehydrogenase [Deltaproteobacteria bacterium]|nr:glucose 1-dehydrogenase [Deltaproteobacteria bacterium]
MGLENKVALVTGGGRGIGRAIALAFAKKGADIVINEIDMPAAEKVVAEVKALGCRSIGVKADVSIKKEIEGMVETAIKEFGKIDILVNNAGISIVGPSEELEESRWNKGIGIDLNGVFFCSQVVGREMINRKRGNIINIASIAGIGALPIRATYCTAKGGVIMLTKSLACDWARYNIRVNAIAPGYIKTEMVEDLIKKGQYDEEALARRAPAGRMGLPEDVANAAVFLASDESDYIAGHTLVVDGAWSVYSYLQSWLDEGRK